jgi:hypothetical protein
MADEVKDFVISQYEVLRKWSLTSSGGLTEDQSVSIPPGANNHILWELGHIVNGEDYLITWGCAGKERLPREWDRKFGYHSKALPDAREYPSLDEIRLALENGRDRTKEYLGSLSVEELASPPKNFPQSGTPSILSVLVHFSLHESYHVGKISLIRKMMGLPSVAELLIEKETTGK